jgi:hypothetical protein
MNYGDVNLSFEKLEILAKVGLYGPWVSVFNGIAILLNINTDCESLALVAKKRFGNRKFCRTYQDGKFIKVPKVDLEDLEFSKTFSVYSEDAQGARNLIKSAFIDRIKKLQKLFNSKKVQASFCDKKLLLTLDGVVNLFRLNASVFKPIDVAGECKQILQQMDLIFSAIDALGIKSKN